MRFLLLLVLAGCTAQTSADQTTDQASEKPTVAAIVATESYSADAYATCLACHLADGVGVPGAFPPIRNRTTTIASLDGGRNYLITAISFGLMGQIDVGGTQYFGIMPGNKGLMTEDAIASALNYLVFELTDDKEAARRVDPFTADEVRDAQSAVSSPSPEVARGFRVELVEKHGEQWPQ
jgi:hypothetical protein